MPEKRRMYDDAFKRGAVRLVTHNRHGLSETARRLGINAKLLGRWKRAAATRPNGAFADNGHASPEPDELIRLYKENQRLRMERDILKKRWSSLQTNRAETCLDR
ncbi:MAG: transposase [Candidatus Tectomicrobia bacterium]|nr:transposase [Candidatus Tectomicrobia bacterium]